MTFIGITSSRDPTATATNRLLQVPPTTTMWGYALLPPSDDHNLLEPALVPAVLADESRATRHLLQGDFGQKIVHLVVYRAANLELALSRATMHIKDMVTSLKGSVCPHFISNAVKHYTKTLSKGREPIFPQLLRMPAPEGYKLCPAVKGSKERRWYQPWVKRDLTDLHTPSHDWDRDPILKVAGPTVPALDYGDPDNYSGATLLGYRWCTSKDVIRSNKSIHLHLHPAKRGRKPP